MPQCALNVYLTPNKYVGGFPFTSKVTGLNPECVGSLNEQPDLCS